MACSGQADDEGGITILAYSGCSKKNTTEWVACKQQKFVAQGSGGQEVQDHVSGIFSVC